LTDDLLRAAEELADAAEVALEDYRHDALDALHRALLDFALNSGNLPQGPKCISPENAHRRDANGWIAPLRPHGGPDTDAKSRHGPFQTRSAVADGGFGTCGSHGGQNGFTGVAIFGMVPGSGRRKLAHNVAKLRKLAAPRRNKRARSYQKARYRNRKLRRCKDRRKQDAKSYNKMATL
jgi:hypothetical protein